MSVFLGHHYSILTLNRENSTEHGLLPSALWVYVASFTDRMRLQLNVIIHLRLVPNMKKN